MTVGGCLIGRLKFWWWGVRVAGPVKCVGLPYIENSPHGTISLGKGCCLRSARCSNIIGVFHPVQLGTLGSGIIQLGEEVGISGSVLVAAKKITVGSRTLIGAGCVLADTDFHPLNRFSRSQGCPGEAKPIVIGEDVWLGLNVTVLKGVSIGDGSIIGAGSVVTKDIPPHTLAAGNPAKVIRQLDTAIKGHEKQAEITETKTKNRATTTGISGKIKQKFHLEWKNILWYLLAAICFLLLVGCLLSQSPWFREVGGWLKQIGVSPNLFVKMRHFGWIPLLGLCLLPVSRFKLALQTILMVVLGGFSFLALCYPVCWESPLQREAAPFTILVNLLRGNNPYLAEAMPANTFVYGILGPISALPLTFIRGLDISNLRVMSVFFMILSSVLIFRFAWRETRQWLPALIFAFFYLYSEMGHAILGQLCNSLGIFLMLLTVLVPYWRKGSTGSLIFSGICAVLAFFTKQFYLVGCGYVACYLFMMISKRRALLYFSAVIAACVGLLTVLHFKFPFLLNNFLFYHMCNSYRWTLVTTQLQLVWHYSWPIILLIPGLYLLYGVSTLWRQIRHKGETSISQTMQPQLKEKIHFLNFNKPLYEFKEHGLLFYFAVAIAIFIFITKTGGSAGASSGLYLYLSSWSMLTCLLVIEYRRNSTWGKQLIIWVLLFSALTYYNYACRLWETNRNNAKLASESLGRVEELVTGKSFLTLVPELVPVAIKHQQPYAYNGHSEYFLYNGVRGKLSRLLYQRLYGTYRQSLIPQINAAWKEKQITEIINKKYQLVFYLPKNRLINVEKELAQGYRKQQQIILPGNIKIDVYNVIPEN